MPQAPLNLQAALMKEILQRTGKEPGEIVNSDLTEDELALIQEWGFQTMMEQHITMELRQNGTGVVIYTLQVLQVPQVDDDFFFTNGAGEMTIGKVKKVSWFYDCRPFAVYQTAMVVIETLD